MLNKYLALTLSFLAISSFLAPSNTLAQYYSDGGSKKTIVVDKKVAFEKGTYWENIEKSKHLFSANDTIYFKIIIENNGNSDLANLKVKDILPTGLSLIYNPGKISDDKKQLVWEIAALGIGQTKTFEIAAKIVGSEETLLKTNFVEASGDSTYDSDRSSYWVAGKTMPKTGPGDLIALSMILSGLAGSSLVGRKLIRGY